MSLDCWRMHLHCFNNLDVQKSGPGSLWTHIGSVKKSLVRRLPSIRRSLYPTWHLFARGVEGHQDCLSRVIWNLTQPFYIILLNSEWNPLSRFWLSCYIPWKSILKLWMNLNLLVLNHWMEQCMEVWYHSYMDLSKIGHPRASLVSMDYYI